MRRMTSLVAAFGIMAVSLSPTSTHATERLKGVCYGPHRDNESPLANGLDPLPSELEQDIAFIPEVAHAVRTYSVGSTLGLIPEMCEEQGLDCYPGCWIGQFARPRTSCRLSC